ncbi:MAG: hypothetical protein PHO10_06015 [Gemmiger sp.]|nr:hypothetical protein [Gemmiger sp.]
MTQREQSPARLLGLCYLLAGLGWFFYCLLGCGVMLYHKASGDMPQLTLSARDLTMESFVNYNDLEWQTAPEPGDDWYLSTDNDPKLYWEAAGEVPVYLETVRLNALHRLPAGSVALYYRLPGQTEYTEAQKVYAACTGEGEYTFDLGGRMVAALRVDPDSVGGVPTRFTGLVLNPTGAWFLRFWPTGGAWLLLLGLPALAAALLGEARGIRGFLERKPGKELS